MPFHPTSLSLPVLPPRDGPGGVYVWGTVVIITRDRCHLRFPHLLDRIPLECLVETQIISKGKKKLILPHFSWKIFRNEKHCKSA